MVGFLYLLGCTIMQAEAYGELVMVINPPTALHLNFRSRLADTIPNQGSSVLE